MAKGTLTARARTEKAAKLSEENREVAAEKHSGTAEKTSAKKSGEPAGARKSKKAADHGAKNGSLQDVFLNHLRREKTAVTMFLVKGVKLQGIVTWFDNFSILLRRDGQSQLVYKHAISTIMPGEPIDAEMFLSTEGNRKQRLLQDVFLASVREANVQVTMFLVNGVMLQGRIAAYDLFCTLLERDGFVQLAYKHAVSTIQPAVHVDLTGDAEEPEEEAA